MALITDLKFEEATDATAAADAQGGLTLTATGSPPVVTSPGWSTHPAGRAFDGSTQWFKGTAGSSAVATAATSPAYTLWGWVFPTSSAGQILMQYCGPSNYTPANPVNNVLFQFELLATTRRLHMYYQYNSVPNAVTMSQSSGSGLSLYKWSHVAVTKELSGSLHTYKFYINGALVQTFLNQTSNASAGGTSSVYWVGRWATNTSFNFFGMLHRWQLHDTTKTLAEVLAEYQNVRRPTVTIVSPTVGTGIYPASILTVRVTDNVLLGRAILKARFSKQKIDEFIHDGDNFGLMYQGAGNTRVAYSSGGEVGYEYTLNRDGGWPAMPELVPYAHDTAGNEAL